MLFLNLYLFHFSKFQMTIVRNLMEKPSFFIMDPKVFMKLYYVTNIFDLQIFGNETMTLLKFFQICTEMHLVSLFFLNERNIAASLLMICFLL